ncbi:hypothetical protein GTH32_10975 [Alteromonas sp. 345S023]|uniref:Uncharacterized protein n=1 Tax=Alteromonas profundi TaxID=2696062 RepID=A0A7X5LLR8_9ALTE|nr:hypothetical protein [Alteromonas profundi]NDV91706.1 hypothetical protein [Alteromonas profundi]
MPNLFEFTANSHVTSMDVLEAQALQVKDNKRLLVVGTYDREVYCGDDFNWAGEKLEIFSEANVDKDIYISVRIDFLDENTVLGRLNNSDNRFHFEKFDYFSFNQAQFIVLKSLSPCNTYAEINLEAQPENGGANRSLSLPISRILLAPIHSKFDLSVLRFALLTGTVDTTCDVYPYPNNSDKIADYFNGFVKELVNES